MKRIFTILGVLSLVGMTYADERPVDAAAVVGHWLLQEVRTNREEIKQSVAKTRFELIFYRDGSSALRLTELDKGTSVSRSGKYRIADGQICMTMENQKEDPVRAVIRDSKLVLLPPGTEVTEEIFELVKEDLPNKSLVPTPGSVPPDGVATHSGAAHL